MIGLRQFLKQANGLDLGKLLSAHMLYWNVSRSTLIPLPARRLSLRLTAVPFASQVVHDKMGVTEASAALDVLMTSKPTYNIWKSLLIGGLCSAFIQPSAFYGSFIVCLSTLTYILLQRRYADSSVPHLQDCLVAIPLGMLLVLVQVAVSKNDLYSSLFESVFIPFAPSRSLSSD